MESQKEKQKREQKWREGKERRERAKRRCEGCVSVETFDIFSQGEDLESCGGVSCGGPAGKPED